MLLHYPQQPDSREEIPLVGCKFPPLEDIANTVENQQNTMLLACFSLYFCEEVLLQNA